MPIRNFNTLSTLDDSEGSAGGENSSLVLRIAELEKVNQNLMKKIKEHEETIRALRKQNEIYAESNRKLFELSSSSG